MNDESLSSIKAEINEKLKQADMLRADLTALESQIDEMSSGLMEPIKIKDLRIEMTGLSPDVRYIIYTEKQFAERDWSVPGYISLRKDGVLRAGGPIYFTGVPGIKAFDERVFYIHKDRSEY